MTEQTQQDLAERATAGPADTELFETRRVPRPRMFRLPSGFTALDVCTVSGLAAVAAAQAGAGEATAIDMSRRAVLSTRVDAMLRGVAIRARREDLLTVDLRQRYDVIMCDPAAPTACGDTRSERRVRR